MKTRTLTRRWGLTGSRPTAVQRTDYEWVDLFAAVNRLTGDSSALLAPLANTDYMNHHLRFIRAQAGSEVQIIRVLGRAGWHPSKALQGPENITPLPLPPCSPEGNPVERLWAYLRSHYLSNRAYRNHDDLFQTCGDAWNRLTPGQLRSICRAAWMPRTSQSESVLLGACQGIQATIQYKSRICTMWSCLWEMRSCADCHMFTRF